MPVNLNPVTVLWSGFYCASCLDACTGYKGHTTSGIPICFRCGQPMTKALDPTQWAIVKDTEALRAIGHRILVLEDEFKSGYECKDCGGTGHTDEKCPHCKGTGMWKNKQDNGACPDCEVGTSDGRKSLGFVICTTCRGRSASIIVPDTAKRRPCTGVILSKGSEVTEFEVGTRVMYTNYTGTDFELVGGTKLRVMLDHDVMCEYKKLKKVIPSIGTGAISKELQDHGIAT